MPVRNRSQFEAAERKIELVAPEELDQALIETVTLGFSMTREDAVSGALALLGFGRATTKIAGLLEERIRELSSSGHLAEVDDLVTPGIV
ncbi:hypothetical protein D3C80_1885850 [compost metagenome]